MGFGVETRMTIDAVRAGLDVAELELELEHRATARDLRGFAHRGRQLVELVLACGAHARAARLPTPAPRTFFAADDARLGYLPLTIVPYGSRRQRRPGATPMTLTDLLQANPKARVLLLGPGGAGKTTELLSLFFRALDGRLGRRRTDHTP